MMRMVCVLIAVAALAGVVADAGPASGQADGEAAPIFGVTIPAGYRDWKLISVAHEEGKLDDLRAILGNDVAIQASREGRLPYPDGTIIARLACNHVASEENNKIFGRRQSFVAGAPKNGVQFMVKDGAKYAATGGWGSRSSTRADRRARRRTRPAFPATRLSRLATSSSTAMHLEVQASTREVKP
jgi:hypothetical protein